MKSNKTSIIAGIISILVIIILIPVFITDDSQDGAPSDIAKWDTVKIGYLPIAAELPLFVAIEEGYFSREGIKYELVRFTSSNELGNAATAGHIDVMSGTASNVIFDIAAVAGKKHQLFIINPYSNAKGHVTDHLIVRKDSKISDLSQLSGKKIASFPGSVNRIFVNLILEKYGVSRDSYEYIEMTPPNWQPALESGSIDAVSALEPAATQIIHDKVGKSIFPGFYADLMADVPLSGHWLSEDYYKSADKDQLVALLRAYKNAVEFIRKNEVEARDYLPEYANVRDDILGDVNLNPWKLYGEYDVEKLQAYIDLLFEHGALQSKVVAREFVKLKE